MNGPKKIFGTDGVRGTAETALKLGRAAGHVFKHLESQPRSRGRHKIVLGKDTRLSGYMLENALSSGILSMGVDVLFIGPLPTPGVAYVTRSLRADAGIVIREEGRFGQLNKVAQLVADAEAELKGQGGRIFLRYSGTEPKARLLLEGRDRAALRRWSRKISEVIRKQVGR